MKNKMYVVTKAIIYAQLMLEAMDEVKELPIFRHSLKMKVNQTEKALEKELGKYMLSAMNGDEEFYLNLQSHIELLINKLCKLEVHELPLVNKIIDEYLDDPEHWKSNLTIQFKELKK
tara:strand:+ start:650 stop:1003 length:354 start_codon:yes stop_codon:yes gene_type:complete